LLLATLVVVALILLYGFWVWITRPADTPAAQPSPSTQQQQQGAVPIEANVSLAAINRYVDMQLTNKEVPLKDAQIKFEDKRVRINTALYFFGRMMNVDLWMRPEVQKNGDLRLIAEEAKMGSWPIPLKTLFAVLEGLPWPPWVQTHSEQYTLDFKLSERDTKGYTYRIQSIDWEKQSIRLIIELTR
jgi:uncharacterized protein YpmS